MNDNTRNQLELLKTDYEIVSEKIKDLSFEKVYEVIWRMGMQFDVSQYASANYPLANDWLCDNLTGVITEYAETVHLNSTDIKRLRATINKRLWWLKKTLGEKLPQYQAAQV